MVRERGWTVSVTATGVPDDVRLDLDAEVDDLVDRLAAYRAVASTADGRRYTVTLAIPGPADAAGAVAVAVGAVRLAADEIGIGHWPIVHTDARTWDEHDVELSADYPPLAGMSEIGEILGASIEEVAALCAHVRFPQPVATLSTGPVWLRDDVAEFGATQALASPAGPR